MVCNFYDWLRNKFLKQADRYEASLWEETRIWESEHSNDYEIWDREIDKEQLELAYDLRNSDPEEACRIYLRLAEQGSVWSMSSVAACYESGFGVARDAQLASDWYTKAIDAGTWSATLDLAKLRASENDFDACEGILTDGVEAGFVPAYFWLAWCRTKRSNSRQAYQSAEPLLKYASERGHPMAGFLYARFMVRGRFGGRNIPRGFRLVVSSSSGD